MTTPNNKMFFDDDVPPNKDEFNFWIMFNEVRVAQCNHEILGTPLPPDHVSARHIVAYPHLFLKE